MKYILYILTLLISLSCFAQEERKYIREGNEHYKNNEFDKADENYKKALQLNTKSTKADFNLGDALYKQKKYAEAIQQFQKVAETSQDKDLKAKSYHNIGNSYLESQKYKESIDAYKKALRENPSDDETRYNLSYAKKKLQEQQKQDEQKKDDKNKDDKNKDKDKNKDDQNKDKDKNKDENKDQKDKDKNEENKDKNENKDEKNKDKQEQNKDKQDQQPNQLSKKDAQRMLDALNNQEKQVQAKLKKKKAKGQKVNVEKDW